MVVSVYDLKAIRAFELQTKVLLWSLQTQVEFISTSPNGKYEPWCGIYKAKALATITRKEVLLFM